MRNAAVSVVLAVTTASWACSNEDMARQAEARAKKWGIPAVQIARDLVYVEYGQRQLKLDVYRPPEGSQLGPVPGIVAVRGGGWREGDKEFFGYIAGQLAVQGFVAASIEYRTVDEAKFPAAVDDVKAAVRWMRSHAAEYGADPLAIGAIGGSAGAHLIAMLAASGDLDAAVAMGGAYDLASLLDGRNREVIRTVTDFIGAPIEAHAETLAAASPIRHVSSRSAPLLLLHSPTDPIAPLAQAVEMERAYRRVGATAVLKTIDAPDVHGFWGDPRYFPQALAEAVKFFHRYLSPAASISGR